jgi:N-acetylmuramoyl-L-alanine amidase
VILSEGGDSCHTQEECSEYLKAEQRLYGPKFGDVLENFYVAEDGQVYEGLGFNVAPFWHVRGLGKDVITVRLIGSFQGDKPTPRAMGGLKLIISTGVWMGKISTDYQMYSLREFYEDRDYFGDSIFRYAKEWNRWAVNLGGTSLRDRRRLGLLPMVSRKDWDQEMTVKSVDEGGAPISNVVIAEHRGLERCYTHDECKGRMREASKRGAVTSNFYVGDDGLCYAGVGWRFNSSELPHSHFNDPFVTISFIGCSEEDVPTAPAVSAFKSLLRIGVEMEHLSPEHKLHYRVPEYGGTQSQDLYLPIESIEKWVHVVRARL